MSYGVKRITCPHCPQPLCFRCRLCGHKGIVHLSALAVLDSGTEVQQLCDKISRAPDNKQLVSLTKCFHAKERAKNVFPNKSRSPWCRAKQMFQSAQTSTCASVLRFSFLAVTDAKVTVSLQMRTNCKNVHSNYAKARAIGNFRPDQVRKRLSPVEERLCNIRSRPKNVTHNGKKICHFFTRYVVEGQGTVTVN